MGAVDNTLGLRIHLMLARIALLLAALSCSTAIAQYARTPFEVQAIEPARAIAETTGINNWLIANHASMVDQQRQGAREHLHALIDAQVKQIYLNQGTFSEPRPDGLLAPLYSWAARLGVYGADLVYAAVKGTYPVPVTPSPLVPAGMRLSLVKENLVLSSDSGGWKATFPYHFFVFRLISSTAQDGRKTEAAVISTGTAPDSAPPGYSQATIGVFFVHEADEATFDGEWAERFGIDPASEQKPIAGSPYFSRSVYDPNSRLHREFVSIKSGRGRLAILYAGLDETYRVNRPHFVDFVRMLSVQQ
jgi:hypothetical protein